MENISFAEQDSYQTNYLSHNLHIYIIYDDVNVLYVLCV